MSTHTVAGNTNTTGIQLGERSKNGLRQLVGDIAIHVIAGIVGGFGGVDVEAGAGAEIVCVVLALDVEAAWKMGMLINYFSLHLNTITWIDGKYGQLT